ncbi:MAG TPA: phosphatase PAP2 family protein [Pirellulales bacterium]|nr:phosphatase PAP2 family protein [Pirellulales bacterium]
MKLRSVTFFLVVLSAQFALARDQATGYFDHTSVDPVKLLPGPPSADSQEAREELDLMLLIQDKRTKADVARCQSEVHLKVDSFQSVFGPWFTGQNLPRLAKLFADLERDSKRVSDVGKNAFRRPRPEHEDSRIHVPIDDETTFAYPSGHATRGMLYALVLSEFAPDQRQALLDRGREIGWDRVVAGLHHPSDIMAGRVLGQALAQSLLADPRFQPELAELKAEFHAAQAAAQPKAAQPAGR